MEIYGSKRDKDRYNISMFIYILPDYIKPIIMDNFADPYHCNLVYKTSVAVSWKGKQHWGLIRKCRIILPVFSAKPQGIPKPSPRLCRRQAWRLRMLCPMQGVSWAPSRWKIWSVTLGDTPREKGSGSGSGKWVLDRRIWRVTTNYPGCYKGPAGRSIAIQGWY